MATQDGTESIETIAVGERVLAKDPKTGETGYYAVTEVFSHTADALVELTIAGEVVSATLEHPFQVQNRGWVAAGELRPGDCVESAAGVCREVERTRVIPGSITVYNFTVETAHTYFVGKGAWWVHNRCSRPTLFRGGGPTDPNFQLGTPTKPTGAGQIDIYPNENGNVVPGKGGLSTLDTPKPAWKYIWEFPHDAPIPDGIHVFQDKPLEEPWHWLWEPAYEMPLSTFKQLLKSTLGDWVAP